MQQQRQRYCFVAADAQWQQQQQKETLLLTAAAAEAATRHSQRAAAAAAETAEPHILTAAAARDLLQHPAAKFAVVAAAEKGQSLLPLRDQLLTKTLVLPPVLQLETEEETATIALAAVAPAVVAFPQ